MTRSKQGIPALAYCDPDDGSPLLLRFIVKTKPRTPSRNESRAQATLCLESHLFLDGYDDEQIFILQYDATNIAPDDARIGNALIPLPLPQERLDRISRGGNPQIRTLSLALKRECPVWCRRADAPRKPRSGEETSFRQLAKLARARKLHILFDYSQLHQNQHEIFTQLVQHPEKLNDYPVHQYYLEQNLIHVDWSALGAKTVDADVNADDDTEDEAWLPGYTQDPLGPVSTHKTRSLLSREDVSLSPGANACMNPTEKDSRVTLSPAPSLDGSAPSPRFSPFARLSPGSPRSPFDTSLPPAIQDAMVRLVNAVLPDVVDCRLTSILKELVDTDALSDDSQESLASRTSVPPPIRKVSELGVLLSKDKSYEIECNIKRLYEHVIRHAAHLRREADVAFFKDVELATSQLHHVAETKLEKFQELCGAHVEGRKQEVEELREDVLQHVAAQNKRLERENIQLKRKNKELRQDQSDLRRYLGSMRVEMDRRETQWKRKRRRREIEPQTKLPKTLPKKMQEKLREKRLSAQKLRKPDDL